jgi:hypothetical protein
VKTLAAVVLVLATGALVDRNLNYSRYTHTVLKIAFEIKRGFIG